jgi:O-antigen ligase
MKYQLEKKRQKSKAGYFYIAMLIVALMCVLMTLSRAGILACLILLFLYFSKTAATKRGLVLFFFAGVFLFFVMNIFYEYTEALIYRVENDGTSSRMELWVDAINTFKGNYWLGAGDYRYYSPNGHLTSHNIYIQLLASQGVVTFICWFGFILSFLLSALKNILKVNIGINPIVVISSMAFVSILVHQVFETMILGSGGPLVLFMFFLMTAIKFTSPPAPLEMFKNA